MCIIKMNVFERGERKGEKISGKIMAMQICFSIDTVFSWPIRKKVIKKMRQREKSAEREGNVRGTFLKCHTVINRESSTFILSSWRKGKTEEDNNCRHLQCLKHCKQILPKL